VACTSSLAVVPVRHGRDAELRIAHWLSWDNGDLICSRRFAQADTAGTGYSPIPARAGIAANAHQNVDELNDVGAEAAEVLAAALRGDGQDPGVVARRAEGATGESGTALQHSMKAD